MTTPIKERGIRWVETYGPKSADLKKRMDHEIGRGSYYRWEGYDRTTDTDYYVVVCPGYSKKKGYFFFAGLRKIPAEHGASGKKFTSQAEALDYAMKTWNVPRPKERAAKAYTVSDIRNKSSVLESQHSGSEAFSLRTRIIVSRVDKKAFSLLGSAGTVSEFVQEFGKKSYPDQLCWAYRASSVMGFLSALNARKRFVGTDVINLGERSKVVNDFTGEENVDAPLAPIMATCESPSEKEYEARTTSGRKDNRLYKITKTRDGKIKKYEPIAPLYDQDSEGYRLYRWKNVRIKPNFTLPTHVLYSDQGRAALEFLQQEGEKYRRPRGDYLNPAKKEQGEDSLSGFNLLSDLDPARALEKPQETVVCSMDPRMYQQFQKVMDNLLQIAYKNPSMKAKINTPNQLESNLVSLLDQEKEKFDWEVPCYEEFDIGGSQLIVYDKLGIPLGMRMGSDERNMKPTEDLGQTEDVRAPDQKKNTDKKEATYIFKSVSDMIAKNMNGSLAIIMAKRFSDGQNGDEKSSAEAAEIIQNITEMQKASLEGTEPRPELRNYLRTKSRELKDDPDVQKWFTQTDKGGDYSTKIKQALDNFLTLKKELVYERNILDSTSQSDPDRAEKQASYTEKYKQFDQLKKNVEPLLKGFQLLSGYNLIQINPEEVVDSRTCADVISNVMSEGYDVDNSGLPLDASNRLADGEQERGKGFTLQKQPYAPKAIGRAKKEALPDGRQTYGVRVFNPNDEWQTAKGRPAIGRHHYVPIPQGVDPSQDMTGMSVITENASMLVPDGKGGLRPLNVGVWKHKDPNSYGKFIKGGTYSVSVSPYEESARKSQRRAKEGAVGSDYFSAWKSEQTVQEDLDGSGQLYHVRRPLPNEPLFTANPTRTRKDPKTGLARPNPFYSIPNPETGEDVDITGDFERSADGRTVLASDSGSLMSLVAKILNLNKEEVGAFTPLTSSDLRIINEKSQDAMNYYEALKSFKANDQSNPELFERGKKFAELGEDAQKFNYGRICSECMYSSKDRISPEIESEMLKSLQDPKASLEPKETDLYGIWYRQKGTENWQPYKNANDEEEYFGSEEAATNFLKIGFFTGQQDKDFKVVSQRTNNVLQYFEPGKYSEITRESGQLVQKISGYKRGLSRQQLEPPRVDRFADDYAPIDAQAEELTPQEKQSPEQAIEEMIAEGFSEEEIAKQLDEQIKVAPPEEKQKLEEMKQEVSQPEEVGIPDFVEEEEGVPDFPPFETLPSAEQPAPVPPQAAEVPLVEPPQQAVVRPVQRPVRPVPPVAPTGVEGHAQSIIRRWERTKNRAQWPAAAKAYQNQPELYRRLTELIGAQPITEPQVSSETLNKLVALAEKYEDEGKHREAEVIDRMINRIASRKKQS